MEGTDSEPHVGDRHCGTLDDLSESLEDARLLALGWVSRVTWGLVLIPGQHSEVLTLRVLVRLVGGGGFLQCFPGSGERT